MAEWILYGVRPNMSISSAIADNAIVLLNAGFICKEDAMVYWRRREHSGCHHLFLTNGPVNVLTNDWKGNNKGNVSAS